MDEKRKRERKKRIRKQGRIHNSISHIQVGRGIDASLITFRLDFPLQDGPTDGPTDQLTNRRTDGLIELLVPN